MRTHTSTNSSVPTLVVTASPLAGAIESASEALARALPVARAVRVGGDHAIDPGGPEIRSFVAEHAVAERRTFAQPTCGAK